MSRLTPTRRDVLRLFTGGLLGTLALNTGVVPWATRMASAFGDDDRIRLALLQHTAAAWHPHPHALTSLLGEVSITTSIDAAPKEETVSLERGDLTPFPLIFVCGNQAFAPWSDSARQRMRRYIHAGGMLVFDSADPAADGGFRQSVTRELQEILPDKKLAQTSQSHVLYKSFYLCRGDEGRSPVKSHTHSIIDEGRIQALYIYNDLLGVYEQRANTNPWGGAQRDRRRDFAYRFGVNLVMYALALDYKEDQVHVPFILRRRRWTVP